MTGLINIPENMTRKQMYYVFVFIHLNEGSQAKIKIFVGTKIRIFLPAYKTL